MLATSDVPGGVVNVLTGRTAELLPTLASHMGVHGIDLAGVGDQELYRDAEVAAAENVKRVAGPVGLAAGDWLDDATGQDPWWIAAFMETKTTWHPAGV